jgi:hypothetical protein
MPMTEAKKTESSNSYHTCRWLLASSAHESTVISLRSYVVNANKSNPARDVGPTFLMMAAFARIASKQAKYNTRLYIAFKSLLLLFKTQYIPFTKVASFLQKGET